MKKSLHAHKLSEHGWKCKRDNDDCSSSAGLQETVPGERAFPPERGGEVNRVEGGRCRLAGVIPDSRPDNPARSFSQVALQNIRGQAAADV